MISGVEGERRERNRKRERKGWRMKIAKKGRKEGIQGRARSEMKVSTRFPRESIFIRHPLVVTLSRERTTAGARLNYPQEDASGSIVRVVSNNRSIAPQSLGRIDGRTDDGPALRRARERG